MTTLNLFGNQIYGSSIPHRQLPLFDKTDFIRTHRDIPAVICRENGERASGAISADTEQGQFTFTAYESGKMYSIPARCCEVSWAGDVAVIAIAESELTRRVSLYGIFTSCCLF